MKQLSPVSKPKTITRNSRGSSGYLRTCGRHSKVTRGLWNSGMRTRGREKGGAPPLIFADQNVAARCIATRLRTTRARDCFVYSSGSLTAFQRDEHRKENCIVIKTAASLWTATSCSIRARARSALRAARIAHPRAVALSLAIIVRDCFDARAIARQVEQRT